MDADAFSTPSVSREGNRLFPWNSFQLGCVLYSHQFLEFTVWMFQCCREDLHWIRIHSTVCHSQDFQTLMCPKHRAEVLPPEITPITALWSVWEKKGKGLIVRDEAWENLLASPGLSYDHRPLYDCHKMPSFKKMPSRTVTGFVISSQEGSWPHFYFPMT